MCNTEHSEICPVYHNRDLKTMGVNEPPYVTDDNSQTVNVIIMRLATVNKCATLNI